MKMIRVDIKPDIKTPVRLTPAPDAKISVRLAPVPNTIVLPDVDYNHLENLPTLNGVKVIGDKTSDDFGIGGTGEVKALTNAEIEALLK